MREGFACRDQHPWLRGRKHAGQQQRAAHYRATRWHDRKEKAEQKEQRQHDPRRPLTPLSFAPGPLRRRVPWDDGHAGCRWLRAGQEIARCGWRSVLGSGGVVLSFDHLRWALLRTYLSPLTKSNHET